MTKQPDKAVGDNKLGYQLNKNDLTLYFSVALTRVEVYLCVEPLYRTKGSFIDIICCKYHN